MKKDSTRDYVTEMFRRYAAAGQPSYEVARRRVYEQELKRHAGVDPAVAQERAQMEVDRRAPWLLDIMAVDSTMTTLRNGHRSEIAAALEAVYFSFPLRPLRRREIEERVNRFASAFPADPRTVYRWLRLGRLLCAEYRGLACEDVSSEPKK